MVKNALVSVILPTFNEVESIVIVIEKIKKIFRNLSSQYKAEIIVVDDNSQDGTVKLLTKRYKKDKFLKVFIRKQERGLGTAIGYGIARAKGEIIIGMDADGNHPPDKIPRMLAQLNNSDLVVASRFIKGGGVEKITDRWRHICSFLFNGFFKMLGSPVWDSTSGFYAIKINKLRQLNLAKIYYGYGDYHLRLVYFAKQANYIIKEVPCIYNRRIGGESKSQLVKMFFSYSKEVLKLHLRLIN